MNENITQTTVAYGDDTLVRVSLNFMGSQFDYERYLKCALESGCIIVSEGLPHPAPHKKGMSVTTLIDTETNQVFTYEYVGWMFDKVEGKTYTPPSKPVTEYTEPELDELFDQPDDLSEYVREA